MTNLGTEVVAELKKLGEGDGIQWLLSACPSSELPAGHPLVELLTRRSSFAEEVHLSGELLMTDKALAVVVAHTTHADWRAAKLERAWGQDPVQARAALAELVAFGTLLDAFPSCSPVAENNKQQTPDFLVPGSAAIEVYCPGQSETDKTSVAKQLASQSGIVRIALSHPCTGSGATSRTFPANAIVDRILNAKRGSRQFDPTLPAILYVDLRQEWNLSADDLLPFRTTFSKGMLWIGTFGAWHAFYGLAGRPTMLGDRAVLRFMREADTYCQQREGFFREERDWAASLLAVRDGLVLFENPWAYRPFTADTWHALARLDQLKAEYCWIRAGASGAELQHQVESTLSRLEWMFREASVDTSFE